MRLSQKKTIVAFVVFSLSMVFFCWILSEVLFKVGNRNILSVKENTQNYTQTRSDIWTSFQRNFIKSNVIAERNNNDSNLSGVACSSELYLTTCGNPGMAALILMTLDHISLCENIGAIPTVFWRNCHTVCPRNISINAWEFFFEPVNFRVEEKVKKVYCLGSYLGPEVATRMKFSLTNKQKSDRSNYRKALLNLSFHPRNVDGFEGIITRRVRLYASSLIKRYIKVVPEIQKLVNNFFMKYMLGYNILAVHIRGTDHWIEMEEGQLPPLMTWIKNAEYHLDSLPSPKRIFIASDNSESIRKFISEFGEKVIFTKAHRSYSYDGESVHKSKLNYYKLGSEVLVDILLMARCRHFLHAESSVASLVSFFNPEIYTHFLDHMSNKENKEVGVKGSRNGNSDLHLYKNDNSYSVISEAFECFNENKASSVCKGMGDGKFINFVD